MPLLHPKDIWNETGRWDSAKEVMYQFEKNEKEYALSFTHEEIVLDLVRKHVTSYKDFPVKIYHFSTKFRDELRAKSGILRGREFLMKDLYSLHTSAEDLDSYYWQVADTYLKTFRRMGIDALMVEAGGGVFTDNITHEFQVFSATGEDIIFFCENCNFAQNKEVFTGKFAMVCPKCKKGKINENKAIEVGNIFRFGQSYSKKMNVMFTDASGQRDYAYLGSYGIGLTRLMGVAVELFNDDRGIIWPEEISPFQVHLVGIMNTPRGTGQESRIKEKAEEIYKKLQNAGVEVLFDDRDTGAGQKFADTDLIGVPLRLVISPKTGDKIEVKERKSGKIELLTLQELLKKLES